MKDQKIIINLPNGDQLVAEECVSDTAMIAIGVMHEGVWIQDLALVETAHDDKFEHVDDKFFVYTYGDEYSEDYTQKIEVNRVPSDAL